MKPFVQQLRLAIRSLTRAPGFALTAMVTLGLGIGLSTAVFSVADALLIRRLPVTQQERLVVLWGETRDTRFSNFPLRLDEAREFAHWSQSLQSVAFFGYYGSAPKPIRAGDRVYRLRRAMVSGNFFDVLGSRPALGRALRAEDDLAGAAPVLVLSYRAWQQQFGGDTTIVGHALLMHETGRSHTIVGVMPQGLDYPRATDFWVPLIPNSTGPDSLHVVSAALDVIGRLRPGASVTDARIELTNFLARPESPVKQRELRGVANTLPTLVLGDTKPALFLLAAATAVLLLLTCINVANLLLVRGLGRTREIVVRMALGAGRARIVGELLTESAILAVAGGVFGIALAATSIRAFVAIAPPDIPRLDEIGVNGTVVMAAIGITACAMMLFAVVPALTSSHVSLQGVLRAGTRQIGGSRRLRLTTEALVVGQIALAVIVLFAAGLITRSLIKLQRVELSYDPRQVLIAELALRADRFDSGKNQRALLDGVLSRLTALPDVDAVTPVLSVPFAGAGFGIDGRLSTPEQTPEQVATNPMLNMEVVVPNYFTTLGIRLLRGRTFSDADREGAPPVVVISESTARQYWPAADPIGKTLQAGTTRFSVIGVVPDTRYRELRAARSSIYFPLRQSFFPVVPMTLIIRTRGLAAAAVPALRSAIAGVDPGVVLASATPFETLLEQPQAQPRLNAMLLSIFAASAALLAAVGLFGVIATMVRQRTRELGIRMALGASQTAIQHMIMARGLSLATLGALVGIAGALTTSRMLSSLLFETTPSDHPTLAIVIALMIGVAAIASFIPARSSLRIDPTSALRNDA